MTKTHPFINIPQLPQENTMYIGMQQASLFPCLYVIYVNPKALKHGVANE